MTTIRHLVRIVVTIAAVFVITGPTFALYFERRLIIRLVLVVVFSLAFAVMLSIMTACKNQEIFAIVAALVCSPDLDVLPHLESLANLRN